MSSITIKHFWLALILLVYSLASFSSPRIGSRLNHPPTMNGDQVFAGVKNQTLHFVLSGASDIDKNSLSYVLVDGPSSGTLKNCLNNTSVLNCEFIPSPEYRGTVSFSYKAFDGTSYSANSNKVTLKIDLDNHAPSTGSNQDFSLKNDKAFRFSLSKGNDPDSDVIFYQLVTHDGSGTLKNCLNGTSSIECEYVPASGINETVNITYKVSDGLIDSSQNALVKLRVGNVNHAPVMKGDQGFGTTKFTLAGASDEDKDTLTYSLVSPSTLPELKNCLNGTTNLNCEFVPSAKGKGPVSFTYKANDGKEDSLNRSYVELRFFNQLDSLKIIADKMTGISPLDVKFSASVSNYNSNISFLWDFGDGEQYEGRDIQHIFKQPGTYLTKLVAKDSSGASASAVVQIMALQESITFSSNPLLNVKLGEVYRYKPQVQLSLGGSSVFSLTNAPQGMSIDEFTGQINWEPVESDVGEHQVVIRATGVSTYSEQRFALLVVSPRVIGVSSISSEYGGEIIITDSGTALDGLSILIPPNALSEDTTVSVRVLESGLRSSALPAFEFYPPVDLKKDIVLSTKGVPSIFLCKFIKSKQMASLG